MIANHGHESARHGGGVVALRTVSRAMLPLIAVLLLTGLSAAIRLPVSADARAATTITTLPVRELIDADRLLTPLGMLTAGLVVLAAAPVVTVLVVALTHGRGRRWREAAFAAAVLAILAMSVAFKAH